METLAFYLLKSVIWIVGFAVIYFLFLQNERYFLLNRLFLIAGILSAIIFPFITWYYKVELQPVILETFSETSDFENHVAPHVGWSFSLQYILLIVYITGALFVFIRNVWQVIPIIRTIKQHQTTKQETAKVIQAAQFQNSFSFISYVFVNPSINKTELYEILNHEHEHIRQKHWVDLLLFEILRTIQWFNPIVWLYGKYIRQNHEYLADMFALKRSVEPGVYHAALLNQVFGGSVISLTNSFNYSFNKKRFIMMNHKYQSPLRKFKLLLILPIIAGIFYAFSAPKYVSETNVEDEKINEQLSSSKIGNITFKGNSVYSSGYLKELLEVNKGDIFSKEKIESKMWGEVYDLYLNNSYVFFNIELKDTVRNKGVADITFKIFEGKQCKFGKIDIEGNEKISSEEIMQIISIRTGDFFTKSKFLQSYNDLEKTGKFKPKSIDPQVNPDLSTQENEYVSVDIVFYVTEK